MGARRGRAGSASALPHLGGSERPRVTAPHLAGLRHAPALPAWGGAQGWRAVGGGGRRRLREGTRGGGFSARRGLLYFLQVKFS